MNTIKSLSLIVAGSVLIASCTSYGQLGAGLTGAAIGSHVGRDIGFLAGGGPWHFGGRNAALGSLIGMGVGAALGVGIQNSIEQNQNKTYQNTQRQYQNNTTSTYGNSSVSSDDYQTGGGASYSSNYGTSNYSNNTTATTSTVTSAPSSNNYVSVDQLTYMDGDGDGYVSKGETIEVETYIVNKTNASLQNVTISLNANDSRYVTLSSPLVTSLSPGQKIRYTGRVYCQKAKSNTPVNVSVNVNTNGQNVSTNALTVYMK